MQPGPAMELPKLHSFQIQPGQEKDKAAIKSLLSKNLIFTNEEIECAYELVSSALADQKRTGDYRVLVAKTEAMLVGYICYGPTPMTESTFDLYWIVTEEAHRRLGIGSALVFAMETEIKALGARLIRVETSTLDGYSDAHRFYSKRNYTEISKVTDFYKPGDDLITLIKYL